jgi:acetyl esterase/lipase
VASYAGGRPLTDSLLSPLYANLDGLPPVQLHVASTDPLLDDSLGFAARVARSRIQVDLRVWPDSATLRTESVPAIADFTKAGLGMAIR